MDDLEFGTATPHGVGHRVPVRAPATLTGPPDVLQGGLAAAVPALAVAAVTDGRVSRVRAHLHHPTPTDADLVATLTPTAGGDTDWSASVATVGGPEPTVTATVDVGGRGDDVDDHADLVRIGLRDPLPRPQAVPAAPDCVVCGARNPAGLHLFPGWFPDGAVAEAWEGDEADAGPHGQFVRPAVVAAVLDCPTVWAARDACREHGFGGALLGGFDVTWYSRLPVGESVRIAAVLDRADGRKLSARSAVVGLDGMVYAVARALQVGVATMPGADPDLDPFGDDLDDDGERT